MGHVTVSLNSDLDGSLRVDATARDTSWSQVVAAPQFAGIREEMAGALPSFDSGRRPFADPVTLAELGARLRDTFFPAFYGELLGELTQGDGRLLVLSSSAECLNLPWELLPGPDAGFLVADGRVAIRRSTWEPMPAPSGGLVAPPLRILFCASAPLDLPVLDYETEEETILRIADRLGGKVHLDIVESGTFDELGRLVSSLISPMWCTSPATASCRTGSGILPSRTSAGGMTRTMAVRWRSGYSRAVSCVWSSSAVVSRPRRARQAYASA